MKRFRNNSCAMVILLAGIVLFGTFAVWANDLYVGAGEAYATIQTAINAANSGDTIHVANGTYAETLDIAKDLTIQGESEAGVIIDTHTFNDYGISADGNYTVTLSNFTVIGPTPATYGYGIKVSGENADITIHNVTVQQSGRSGIDLNGVAQGDLKNITVLNNGGVGLAITDSSNVTVDGITTSGNAWAGMAVYTYGVWYAGGSDNITLTGTNSFGEATSLYTEEENNYPITNLNIPVSDFAYTVSSNTHANVVGYYPDLTTASGAAVAGDPDNAFINDRSTGDFVVVPGLNIQSAVDAAQSGDTVHVLAGDYSEQVFIGKDMVLAGTVGASVKSPGSTKVTIPESTNQFDPIIFVYGGTMDPSHAVSGSGVVSADVKNLDVDGQNSATSSYFVGMLLRNVNGEISSNAIHDMFGTNGKGNGPQTFGILVYGDSTVDILNNAISDFSRGGIGIMGDAGTAPDPVARVEGNVVTGNGMETETGWWAENGIQFGYGASGEIVGNTVTDCAVNNPNWTATGIIVVDTNNVLVAGNTVSANETGISVTDFPGVVYGSPWDASAVSNVTVQGNSLDGNDWALDIANDVSDVAILFNVFTDTTYDAIDVYSYDYYFPGLGIPYPSNVVIHYNSITGSGGDGLWVMDGIGSPVDAILNWWGDVNGPSGEGAGGGDSVSTNVIFSPWLGTAPDGDPAVPGVQITGPMTIIVAPVGPAPASGYLNAAIAGANSADLPYADTIEVKHGTYDATEPITDAVNIVSETGSAAHTTLNGNMSINGNGVLVGLPLQGFRVNGNVTVGAGADAGTSGIHWCDLYGNVTNNGTGTFNAQYNYWGTLLESVVDARTTGLVDYDPFLPENADDSYVDATAIMAAGLASGIDPAIDQLWLMVQLGQDVNTFIGYSGVAGAGAFAGAPAGATINLGGAAGGGGAVEGTISGTYTIGDPIEGQFTLTDPVTGEPVTDAAVTTSLLGPDGALVSWGCATYDESTGEYVFSIDTSGLAPGTYELIIQTDDGQSKTVSIEVQAA